MFLCWDRHIVGTANTGFGVSVKVSHVFQVGVGEVIHDGFNYLLIDFRILSGISTDQLDNQSECTAVLGVFAF